MSETLRENFETPSVDGVDVRLEATDRLLNLQLDKSDFENFAEEDVKEMWKHIDVNNAKDMVANIDLGRAKQTLKGKGFTENEISETENYLKEVKANPNQLENDLNNPGIPPLLLPLVGPFIGIYGAWLIYKKNTPSIDNEGPATDTIVESYEEKKKYIKEALENSALDEDEKETVNALVEGVEEDKGTVDSLYYIVKKYAEKNSLDKSESAQKLTKEILLETTKYAMAEPKKLHQFIEKLHLPMNKKDILASAIITTALAVLGMPIPVGPITLNSLYNSAVILEQIDKKLKSDAKLSMNIFMKVVDALIPGFKRIF